MRRLWLKTALVAVLVWRAIAERLKQLTRMI